jgi:hypothetical protein
MSSKYDGHAQHRQQRDLAQNEDQSPHASCADVASGWWKNK